MSRWPSEGALEKLESMGRQFQQHVEVVVAVLRAMQVLNIQYTTGITCYVVPYREFLAALSSSRSLVVGWSVCRGTFVKK